MEYFVPCVTAAALSRKHLKAFVKFVLMVNATGVYPWRENICCSVRRNSCALSKNLFSMNMAIAIVVFTELRIIVKCVQSVNFTVLWLVKWT